MSKITRKEAAKKILEGSPHPLHYTDIAERAISEGLLKTVGATPAATINVAISGSIKGDGEKSPFIRVGKGMYALKEGYAKKGHASAESESGDEEEQYGVISSFGMFWRRDAINWKKTKKCSLFGEQGQGAKAVDFYEQRGVYLLYDGREVIYVGRTTERPLGQRLYEHTIDRLSTRWDRFSWFGLLPVSDAGKLGSLSGEYEKKKFIPVLESVLIEALEPRQNRRQGDDLKAIEYNQAIDPEIGKEKIKAVLDTL